MKRITFKKLYIQNFLSIGEEPVEIDFTNGVNVITGINHDENETRNGVGKSSILDSFYFALFGSTMRDLSKLSFVINRKIGKNCVVRLEIDVEDSAGKNVYLIERKLAPQSLKIWKNAKDITRSTTAETNKFIAETFSAEKDIFQNCIVMRANNTIPFMGKKKTERKSFIETIFNLNIFTLMQKYLKDDLKEIKTQYTLEQNNLNLHIANIENYQKQLNHLKKLQAETSQNHENEIAEINSKINEEITNYNILKKNYNELISQKICNDDEINKKIQNNSEFLKKLHALKYKLTYDEQSLKKDLEKLENMGSICPTCNQKYPENFENQLIEKKDVLGSKVSAVIEQLKIVSDKISELEVEKYTLDEQLKVINDNKIEIKLLYDKIGQSERIIKLYKEQLNTKKEVKTISGISNFEELIDNTQKTIDNIKISLKIIENNINKLNICEHVLGEYGIRAYVVNKLLDIFNDRIQYYLQCIKSTFYFRFNEYFEEEIKDSNGIICQYANCSGAEMKKIDLAISFAINDMLNLQKQISYNVIFFDEILDSSVDDKSLNIILNFISEYTQKENKSVYIISHKSGAQIPFINEVITLEKTNGFTKRIIN